MIKQNENIPIILQFVCEAVQWWCCYYCRLYCYKRLGSLYVCSLSARISQNLIRSCELTTFLHMLLWRGPPPPPTTMQHARYRCSQLCRWSRPLLMTARHAAAMQLQASTACHTRRGLLYRYRWSPAATLECRLTLGSMEPCIRCDLDPLQPRNCKGTLSEKGHGN